VDLPDGSTKPGRVTSVGAVAQTAPAAGGNGSDGGATVSTVSVTVTLRGAIRGFIDRAAVQVMITERAHTDVLAVPITALRAVPGGRYEVVVVLGGTTRHVPVQTGLFDETSGLAEVSAPELAAGQRVEVPREGA
jgi:HlyD family secretion protein